MFRIFKEYINGLKLNARFNLFIATLLIIIFSTLGYYLYNTQKDEIFRKTEDQFRILLYDLLDILSIQTTQKEKQVNTAIEYCSDLLQSMGGISENRDDYIKLDITDLTGRPTIQNVYPWQISGNTIQDGNNKFVDKLLKSGIDGVAIFQKTPDGYLRVSSSVLPPDTVRFIGTMLPNSSPSVRTIESSKNYIGREFVNGKWYLAAYTPLMINGEIKGMIEILVNQFDKENLRKIFYTKKYFKTGYPYVVSGDGFSVINVSGIEGTNLNGTNFFAQLQLLREELNPKDRKFRYMWPEDESGTWKWTYFEYFEPLDSYIATSVFESELMSSLEDMRKGVIIGVILSIIIFFLGISRIVRPITSAIENLADIIEDLSMGKMVKLIKYDKNDEIGKITKSLNTLIKALQNTAKFSNELGRGLFKSEYIPLSNEDLLGNSLLEMRSRLVKAKEEEDLRILDDNKRQWTNEGFNMFSDILRRNTNNMAQLSEIITKTVVKYMKASQCGLFLRNEDSVNTDNIESIVYDLASCYAYDRKKKLKSKFLMGEGLIGSCAREGMTIHLRNLPQDYMLIESGLGDANPNNLLLIPLKLQASVLGVIEITSFNEFKQHEVSFLERLAESIASTISIARINARTVQLLSETQTQATEIANKEKLMRLQIDELQRVQENSARREAELRGVVSALDASFLVAEVSMDGVLHKANQMFLDFFKLTSENILSRTLTDIVGLDSTQKDEYEKIWIDIKGGLIGRKIQTRHFVRERELWLSQTYTPIFDSKGRPYKVLNIAIDITAAKLQEKEINELLKDSEKTAKKMQKHEKLNTSNLEKLEKMQIESGKKEMELKGMLDSLDNMVLRAEYDLDGNLLSYNSRFLASLELNAEDLQGSTIRTYIPPEDLVDFENVWKSVSAGSTFEGILKRKTKSDADVYLLTSYYPLKDKKNVIYKILFLATDFTKQKMFENRIKLLQRQLTESNEIKEAMTTQYQDLQNSYDLYKKEAQLLDDVVNDIFETLRFDAKGTIQDCNDIYLKNNSVNREDIIGKKLHEIQKIETHEEEQRFLKFWIELEKGNTLQNIIKNKENTDNVTLEVFTPILQNNKLFKVIYMKMSL